MTENDVTFLVEGSYVLFYAPNPKTETETNHSVAPEV